MIGQEIIIPRRRLLYRAGDYHTKIHAYEVLQMNKIQTIGQLTNEDIRKMFDGIHKLNVEIENKAIQYRDKATKITSSDITNKAFFNISIVECIDILRQFTDDISIIIPFEMMLLDHCDIEGLFLAKILIFH